MRGKVDDLGAQAVALELGGLPVVEDTSSPQGSVRVVLSSDYTGPGAGLDGTDVTLMGADPTASDVVSGDGDMVPPPSPIITAGSNDPQCVN